MTRILISLLILVFAGLNQENIRGGFLLRFETMRSQRPAIVLEGDEGWLPSPEDVDAAANALRILLKKQASSRPIPQGKLYTLSDYTIRYTGITGSASAEKGLRLIAVDGFCHQSGLTEKQIREGASVDDGGCCYFSGIFNPATGRLENFSFNGNS